MNLEQDLAGSLGPELMYMPTAQGANAGARRYLGTHMHAVEAATGE